MVYFTGMSEECCQQLVPLKRVSGSIHDALLEELIDGKQPDTKRKCGCMKTSTKLRKILGKFPAPPPPTPVCHADIKRYDKGCGYTYGHGESKVHKMPCTPKPPPSSCSMEAEKQQGMENAKSWKIVSDLVTLVQLSVTATALALYYLIYCYMQIVYFTLKSAMYFLNADGPMKVTIGVVAATAIIIAFNILMRIEQILSIIL